MIPGTPEWAALVTASKVPAILGLSPWDSPLTTWLKMHGDLPSDDGKNVAAKSRGHYLEQGCIDWWLDQSEQIVHRLRRHPDAKLDDWAAATPDALAENEDGRTVLVEVKTDGQTYEWLEIPAHYAAQGLFQLACFPQAQAVHFAVLHAGLTFREYVLERDDELIDSVVAACRTFYDSLAGDVPPELSGQACEYEALRRVTTGIDKGESVQIDDDLADALVDAYRAEKSLGGLRARVLDAIGTAQYATNSAGQRIARRQPSGAAIALYVTPPKTEEAAA